MKRLFYIILRYIQWKDFNLKCCFFWVSWNLDNMRIILLTINFKASTKLHSFTFQHGSRPKNQIDHFQPYTIHPPWKPTARPPRSGMLGKWSFRFWGAPPILRGKLLWVPRRRSKKTGACIQAVGLLGWWVPCARKPLQGSNAGRYLDTWRERKSKYVYQYVNSKHANKRFEIFQMSIPI